MFTNQFDCMLYCHNFLTPFKATIYYWFIKLWPLWKEMKLGNIRLTISTGWLVFNGSIDSVHQTHLSHHTVNPSPWPPNKYLLSDSASYLFSQRPTREQETENESYKRGRNRRRASEGGCEGGKEGVFVQNLTEHPSSSMIKINQIKLSLQERLKSRVTEQENLIQ